MKPKTLENKEIEKIDKNHKYDKGLQSSPEGRGRRERSEEVPLGDSSLIPATKRNF
jgi:hypothetical protein